MRSIFAIIFIGGLVSMYVFIPEAIEQLIKMGYLADKTSYRDVGWTRFWMPIILTVALVLLFCISFFIFSVIHSWSWNQKIKKATHQSMKMYGVKFLYFTFFDKNIQKYYIEHVNPKRSPIGLLFGNIKLEREYKNRRFQRSWMKL